MEGSPNTPISTRTRSQKQTTQHSTSDGIPSTTLQETNEDLTQVSVGTEKHQPVSDIGNGHEEYSSTQEMNESLKSDKYLSYSNIQLTATNRVEKEKNEMKEEKFNDLSHSNIQLQHLQETFAAELAQKQKIIEDQRQLLIQQQLNIQELMNGNMKKQHHGFSVQSTIYDNNKPDSLSSAQTKSPSAHKPLTNNLFKYDNFIEQQLIKDKINNIRKFSGNKVEDVDEWLQNIEDDFSSTLVSEEIKLKLIPKSLSNDAQNWFEQNKHRLLTWTTFKIEIQHRFQSSLHKDQKFIRLRERKQQHKETGQQFIDAMEKLCFQVNSSMMEQEKMLHIKAGLKPSLKEKVLDKQPQSMDELRNTVKRIEDIEAMLNDGNNNEEQMPQPSFSSKFDQPSQYDNNCYALPSHYNKFHHDRRQNTYHYQQHQQQEMDQQMYRPNQNYSKTSLM